MTFEETLKSKGFTDADLADPTMKPILERFRPAYEEVMSERDKYKTDFEGYKTHVEGEWVDSVNKRIADEEEKAKQARREAAQYQEELKIAKDYGYLPTAAKPTEAQAAQAAAQAAAAKFDPKQYKLLTEDDAVSFAKQQATAMAMFFDVDKEYSSLTGKSLLDYEGQDGSRGMTALLAESQSSRAKNLREFAQNKFKFQELRQAKAAEAQKLRDDAIRKEAADATRAEMAAQYGNPNLRTPMPSRSSFIGKPADGKKPWEMTEAERDRARQERAMQSQFKQQVQ